jgi:L-ribulose-5-phosphate 3-epimerase
VQKEAKGFLMQTISFMTANFVARQLNYQMVGGWGEGDQATQNHFKPLDTYKEHLSEIFQDIAEAGFSAVDIWGGHLNPHWASPEHMATASALLENYELKPISFAGWWENLQDLESTCQIANYLGIKILGGGAPVLSRERAGVIELLERYDLYLGYENHPERSAEEMLEKIGDSADGRIGLCLDTGWFGTHGVSASEAIKKLSNRLLHIHLKDVLEVGSHNTCRFGEGIVGIEEVVDTLKAIGYQGGISVEHEPHDKNPLEDVKASYDMLKGYLLK